MMSMIQKARAQVHWQDEEGSNLLEYAFLILLIALAAQAVLQALGVQIATLFSHISSLLVW